MSVKDQGVRLEAFRISRSLSVRCGLFHMNQRSETRRSYPVLAWDFSHLPWLKNPISFFFFEVTIPLHFVCSRTRSLPSATWSSSDNISHPSYSSYPHSDISSHSGRSPHSDTFFRSIQSLHFGPSSRHIYHQVVPFVRNWIPGQRLQ